jgi:nucleotide-binding universal stress UspA family protein
MYERILVPLDGSALAESVLGYVEELAKRLGSELVLLHAVPPLESFMRVPIDPIAPPVGVNAVEIHEAAIQAGTDYLAGAKARFDSAGLKSTTVLVDGQPERAILDYIEREKPLLIAMATHGRGGLSRLVMGSVADAIVRKSHLPVLLLRPGEDED